MDCSPPGSSVHGDSPGKEHWSGLSCPSPGDFPNPEIESRFPVLQAGSLPSEPPEKPGEPTESSLESAEVTEKSTNQAALLTRLTF